MINFYYNDWWHYQYSNFSFFKIDMNIIHLKEVSFLDKELYDFIIEPKFLLYYI
jgi:hypothetical protein